MSQYSDESYRDKSYGQLVEESIQEESDAGKLYDHMATLADTLNFPRDAAYLRAMAHDERHHLSLLKNMNKRAGDEPEGRFGSWVLRAERDSIRGSVKPFFQTGVEQARTEHLSPVPKSEEEWEALADKLWQASGAGDGYYYSAIQSNLFAIVHNYSNSEEAKRWFVEQAGKYKV